LEPTPSEAAPAPVASAATPSAMLATGGEQWPLFDEDTSPAFNGNIIE
jgi:hypothetical protein